jgi:hypothetical protein
MYSIQILLPLFDKEGKAFAQALYAQIRDVMTEKFGGITAYTRAPAKGFWKEDESKTVKDDIIILEIMAEVLDSKWWAVYRQKLEQTFQQDAIVIRSWQIEML